MPEQKHFVKVQLKGKKAWNFLKTNGDLSKNRIHGVVYPSKETAQAEADHINKNYSEYYNAKIEEV